MNEHTSLPAYLEAHRQEFLNDLFDLMRRQTVSADPQFAGNLRECAQHLADFAREQLGFRAEVVPTEGHPCVIMHGPELAAAPRVLIYGHYDVQPAEDIELWRTPPFEPYADEDAIHGRGACDDKGQFSIWLSALKALRHCGGYPLNISVILEGEEEIGSPHFTQVLEQRAQELKADLVIVSDTSSAVKRVPTMHYSLRGLVTFEIYLRTAKQDLHSGVHGGVSPNAPRELAALITKLYDENGRVAVPGFYEGVRDIAAWEAELLAKVPFDEEEYAAGFDTVLRGEAGFTTNQRRWFRPTLECNGLFGGYTGVGSKTIVPALATAKFSARLVADQEPQRVMDCLQRWFAANTPPWVKLDFVPGDLSKPYLLDQSGVGAQLFKAVGAAVQAGFGCEPLICRNGGAIGVVAEFSRVLQAPTLLLGFGSPDDNIHGPNEKFELPNFVRGIAMGAELLPRLAECL